MCLHVLTLWWCWSCIEWFVSIAFICIVCFDSGCELGCGHFILFLDHGIRVCHFTMNCAICNGFLTVFYLKMFHIYILFCRQFERDETKTVSLCNLDWPRACSVDQVSLELTVILLFHLHSAGIIGICRHVWYYAVLGMKAWASCMLGKLSTIWATSPRPKKSLLVLMLILLWLSIGCIKCFSINVLGFCFY